MLGIIGVLKYFNILDVPRITVSDLFAVSLIVDPVLRYGITLEQNFVSFEETIFNYDLKSISDSVLMRI